MASCWANRNISVSNSKKRPTLFALLKALIYTKPESSPREPRDTPRPHLFQPVHELRPDGLLQALAFRTADPIRHPVLLDLATRQQLPVAFLAGHQSMQDGATAHLRRSCHHGPNSCMILVKARASRPKRVEQRPGATMFTITPVRSTGHTAAK